MLKDIQEKCFYCNFAYHIILSYFRNMRHSKVGKLYVGSI